MDGNIKLSATVISCTGNDSDKDDFYFNGNFANCHNTQSIQCSFEKYSNNYIFAVSDSMGVDDGSTDNISAIREIKKYHESAKKNQFTLETITEKIYEAVQLSSNLIYSRSIISSQNASLLTGFSSLIIDNNRAVIMNLGNNGAILFRQGENIEVFNRSGSKKNEKLKMLGISPNTAEMYNDKDKILKLAEEESKTKIKISQSFEIEEGDIIILCSDGLLSEVSKSRIESVVNSGFDSSKIASVLFQEASKSGFDQGITIMAIRIDEIRNGIYSNGNRGLSYVDYENEAEEDESESPKHSIVNYILAFICVLVISGVLFMGYLIMKNSGLFMSDNNSTDASQSSMVTDNSDASSSSLLPEEDSEDTTGSESQSGDAQPSDSKPSESKPSETVQNDSKQQPKPADQSPSNGGTDQNANTQYEVYTVQSGDTLSSISTKFYNDPNKYDAIIKFNNLKDGNSLYVGQELKIPKANQ